MKTIFAPGAPKAVGPYCHAVQHGDMLFTSGQLAIDPATNQLVNSNIKKETLQVLKNLETVLTAAGSDKSKVIKVNIYITDLKDFSSINEVYAEFFGSHTPARATVEVSNLALGAKIEIEMVAAL